jgi:hypothetical protein
MICSHRAIWFRRQFKESSEKEEGAAVVWVKAHNATATKEDEKHKTEVSYLAHASPSGVRRQAK